MNPEILIVLSADNSSANKGVSEVSGELDKLKDSSEKSEKSVKSVSDKLRDLGRSATEVGLSLQIIGKPVADALQNSISAAIDFESAFAGVRKTVDASENEFRQLSDNLREMAKITPTSATELAKIEEIAGQLGVRGVENLTKFTDTVAKIGVSTDLTTEAAAKSFARIANIMQEPLENIDRMGAVVVDLGNNFATTEPEIVEFTNRIAGAGKIANLTTTDIFSISTAFSSVGVQAEAGGTAVQKVLMAMTQAAAGATDGFVDNTAAISKNTKQVADLQGKLAIATQQQKEFGDKTKESTKMAKQAQIDKYTAQIASLGGEIESLNATHGQAIVSANGFAQAMGMTNDQFKKLFKENPAKAFEEFVAALGKSGSKAISILEDLELGDQRLMRGFLSLAQNSDLLTTAISKGNKAWKENSALSEEAGKRFETTESQIQILKNRMTDLGITIGDALLPSISSIAGSIGNAIDSFNEWSKSHQGVTQGILAVGAAVTALGGALLVLGPITAAFGAILGVLGGPITAIVLGAAALAGVIVSVAAANDLFSSSTDAATAKMHEAQGASQALTESWSWLQTEQQKQIDTTFSNANYVQTLVDKLELLIDGNGRVREGFEGQAKVLAEEINKYYPETISLTEKQSDLYVKMAKDIDLVIAKEKLKALTMANAEAYQIAIVNNKNLALENRKLKDEVDKVAPSIDAAIKKYADWGKAGEIMSGFTKEQMINMTLMGQGIKMTVEEFNAAQMQVVENEKTLQSYSDTIASQTELAALAAIKNSGDLNAALAEYEVGLNVQAAKTLTQLNSDVAASDLIMRAALEERAANRDTWNANELLALETQHNNLLTKEQSYQLTIGETISAGAWTNALNEKLGLDQRVLNYGEAGTAMLNKTNTSYSEIKSSIATNGAQISKDIKGNAYTAQQNYAIEIGKMQVTTELGMSESVKAITGAEPAFNQGGHDVGIEANRGAAQGIKDGKSSVLSAIGQWASDIIGAAKDALGIHSPSKVFAEIGGYSAQGFAEGLLRGIERINVPEIVSTIIPEISSPFVEHDSGSSSGNNYDQSSNINISGVTINEPVDLNLFGQFLAASIENRIY